MSESKEKEPTEKQLALRAASDSIAMAIRECGVVALRDQPAFMQAIRMAYGIKEIRKALNDQFMTENIMPLQNIALGFLTDKQDSGGYPLSVVRDALCEALLRGFQPVNNEFNIIAGRFYGAKNGYERIVRTFPGISRFDYVLGVPAMAGDKGALVSAEARWTFAGEQHVLRCEPPGPNNDGIDTRIPVRVNSGMGADAILGKATRKLFFRVYNRLLGLDTIVDDDEPAVIPAEGTPAPLPPADDGRRIKLGKRNGSSSSDVPYNKETGEVLEREPGAEG